MKDLLKLSQIFLKKNVSPLFLQKKKKTERKISQNAKWHGSTSSFPLLLCCLWPGNAPNASAVILFLNIASDFQKKISTIAKSSQIFSIFLIRSLYQTDQTVTSVTNSYRPKKDLTILTQLHSPFRKSNALIFIICNISFGYSLLVCNINLNKI